MAGAQLAAGACRTDRPLPLFLCLLHERANGSKLQLHGFSPFFSSTMHLHAGCESTASTCAPPCNVTNMHLPFCLTQYEATRGVAIPTHQILGCTATHYAWYRRHPLRQQCSTLAYSSYSKIFSTTSYYMPTPTSLHNTVVCKWSPTFTRLRSASLRPQEASPPTTQPGSQLAPASARTRYERRQLAAGLAAAAATYCAGQILSRPLHALLLRIQRILRHVANTPAPTHVSKALLRTMR